MIRKSILEKICALLNRYACDALMVTPSSDFKLLVNLDLVLDERLMALIIKKDGSSFVLGPKINKDEILEHFAGEIPVYLWDDGEWFYNEARKALCEYGLCGCTLALGSSVLADPALDIARQNDITLINGSGIMEAVRIIKDSEEIENLRKSAEIADQVMVDLQYILRPGKTEKEIAQWVVKRYLELGGNRNPSDIPLVASGPNGAIGHYDKGLRTIAENDVVVVDSGCTFNGYHSDTTRTFFVGKPSVKQQEIFNIVRDAQQIGEQTARPGIRACDVDKAVRNYIEQKGYGPLFYHRTGHGIGRDGHERPYISSTDTTVLEPGMCFSIEPGIYFPGEFGVRLENIVVVTSTGCEALNKATMELFAKD